MSRCFENGESIKSVSEDTGYSRSSIYTWRSLYFKGGSSSLISNKKRHT
ncbi:MAG: helix-turn-helix domain-containing protein [Breznakia sp.]